jgi:uncharacterized phage-like protein YoqJ
MKITFLGHRQQDLGGFEENQLQKAIKAQIETTLLSLNKPILLTSMMLGIEMWAAEIAHKHGISYHVYVPFDNFHARWPFPTRKLYSELLKHAKKKVIIDDGIFDYKKMVQKDVQLVTDAKVIYSLYKDTPSLLKKALKDGKEVINILPKEDDDWFIAF